MTIGVEVNPDFWDSPAFILRPVKGKVLVALPANNDYSVPRFIMQALRGSGARINPAPRGTGPGRLDWWTVARTHLSTLLAYLPETHSVMVRLEGRATELCTAACQGAREETWPECTCCCGGKSHGGGAGYLRAVGDGGLVVVGATEVTTEFILPRYARWAA